MRQHWTVAMLWCLALAGAGCNGGGETPTVASFPGAWVSTQGLPPSALGDARLSGDALFVVSESGMSAYETASGALRWTQRYGSNGNQITLDAVRVFSSGRITRALDQRSGAVLWSFQAGGDTTMYAWPAAADGRVFVGTISTTTVYALNAATGQRLWVRHLGEPDWRFGGTVRSLTLHDGTLYAVGVRHYNDALYFRSTFVAALDPATGAERWRFVDGDGTSPHNPARGLSFAGDFAVWADFTFGFVAAFDIRTRQVAWRHELDDNWIGATQAPIVEDGRAYVSTGQGFVLALDVATGRVLWTGRRDGSYDTHALCGAYVGGAAGGGADSYVKATGAKGPAIHMGKSLIRSSLVSDGQRFYLAAADGVYAYDCTP